MTNTRNFWPNCGYDTLTVNADNHLQISDDFLRLFYQRPELEPIDSSCTNERNLHHSLLEQPRRIVDPATLKTLADPDAQENYQFALNFRDFLVSHETLEDSYLAIASGREQQNIPPLLLDLIVQLIVKHILLQNSSDAYQLRAAELLFRKQQVSLQSGIIVADADWLHRHRRPEGLTALQSLIKQAGGVPVDAQDDNVELLTKYTTDQYWRNSEAHELGLSLDLNDPGITALCTVLELWLAHFHDVKVTITAVAEIQDEHWRWHVGLDVQSNQILNKLYTDNSLNDDEQSQLLALFCLEFDNPRLVQNSMQGYPVYLGLAMDSNFELRLKPQNLLLNLPLALSS